MPDTRNVAPGLYWKVTGSPANTELIPESCHPPISASVTGDGFDPQRWPWPNGSDHTKLVVLLYGWW